MREEVQRRINENDRHENDRPKERNNGAVGGPGTPVGEGNVAGGEGRGPEAPGQRVQSAEVAPKNFVADHADKFNQANGRPEVDATVKPHSPEFAKSVADAYDRMKHNPDDPHVKAAYTALKGDVRNQWGLRYPEDGYEVRTVDEGRAALR